MTPAYRQVSWGGWLAWVVACAFAPIANQIAFTAAFKEVLPNDPSASLIKPALWAIIAISVILPRIVEAAALRLAIPRLSFFHWMLAMLLAWGVYVATSFVLSRTLGSSVAHSFTSPSLQLALDWWRARQTGTATLSTFWALQWIPWIVDHVSYTVVTAIFPAMLLGSLSGAGIWRFLVAALVGSLSASFAEIFLIETPLPLRDGLNGMSWLLRLQTLAPIGATGVVWGASSGLALVLLMRDRQSETPRFALERTSSLLFAVCVIAVAADSVPVAISLVNPVARQQLWQSVQKTLSSAPADDRPTGEDILVHSHDADVVPNRFPIPTFAVASFAPDGDSFITLGDERRFERIETSTGRRLAELGEPQRPQARWHIVWSPDGKYLATRTEGAEIAIPNTNYKQRQTRIRLYDTASNKEIATFETTGDSCFDNRADSSMMFSSDERALWIGCGQHYTPKDPSTLEAIRLSVPDLRLEKSVSVGRNGRSSPRSLFLSADSAREWRSPIGNMPLVVRDLDQERDVAIIPSADLVVESGGRTLQRGIVRADGTQLELVFCGLATDQGEKRSMSDCRSVDYDLNTGSHLATRNWTDNRDFAVTSVHYSVRADISATRKAGDIIVTDVGTGKERQRIHSMAQRPISFSPDGQWLVMFAPDLRKLRIYKVLP